MIEEALREYAEIREKEKLLKERKDQLSKYIKEYVSSNGAKDSKGSYYSENEKFVYGSQAKKSVKINEDKAKNFFSSKGLLDKVITTVEQVDETKIEQLIAEGEISPEDIEEIVDIKVSYSLDVRVKEEIKEVVPTSRENSIKPRGKITLRKVKKIIKDKH